jgi:hypothetical protein
MYQPMCGLFHKVASKKQEAKLHANSEQLTFYYIYQEIDSLLQLSK